MIVYNAESRAFDNFTSLLWRWSSSDQHLLPSPQLTSLTHHEGKGERCMVCPLPIYWLPNPYCPYCMVWLVHIVHTVSNCMVWLIHIGHTVSNRMVWLSFEWLYQFVCDFLYVAVMSVMLSHHSGPVVVSAASNSHIVHYLAAEKINFKVHVHHIIMHVTSGSLVCAFALSSIGILNTILNLFQYTCRIHSLLVSTSLSPFSSVASRS